jgi:hypothetical protein
VLWLMALAGYVGRDVAGLGAAPPAEPVPEDDDPEATADVEDVGAEPPGPELLPDAAPVEPTPVPAEPVPEPPPPGP